MQSGPSIDITFSVMGYVKQRVVMLSGTGITPEKLQTMLNNGEVVTTIQENGKVEVVASGKVIGFVENIYSNCEYSDFVVESIK